jgi:hypothetical protein
MRVGTDAAFEFCNPELGTQNSDLLAHGTPAYAKAPAGKHEWIRNWVGEIASEVCNPKPETQNPKLNEVRPRNTRKDTETNGNFLTTNGH